MCFRKPTGSICLQKLFSLIGCRSRRVQLWKVQLKGTRGHLSSHCSPSLECRGWIALRGSETGGFPPGTEWWMCRRGRSVAVVSQGTAALSVCTAHGPGGAWHFPVLFPAVQGKIVWVRGGDNLCVIKVHSVSQRKMKICTWSWMEREECAKWQISAKNLVSECISCVGSKESSTPVSSFFKVCFFS